MQGVRYSCLAVTLHFRARPSRRRRDRRYAHKEMMLEQGWGIKESNGVIIMFRSPR